MLETNRFQLGTRRVLRVYPGEIGAERAGESVRIRHERRLTCQSMRARDAGHTAHDEEFAPEHAAVPTEKKRFRREYAGRVRDAQYRKLLRARHACRNGGRRIGAQHETVHAMPGATLDVDIERPVVLDAPPDRRSCRVM